MMKDIDEFLAKARQDLQTIERQIQERKIAEAAAQERISTLLDIRSMFTYHSSQATKCAVCGEHKHTPIRNDAMGGYVCLTCIDKELQRLQVSCAQLTHVCSK